MGREIKFRGLDVMTGDWVYGSHVKTGLGMHYIIPQNLIADSIPQFKVDKETVGEYTGLKDKNGKEIFEGDILKTNLIITKVHWIKAGWYETVLSSPINHLRTTFPITGYEECEVIGNIYDNPELLEGER